MVKLLVTYFIITDDLLYSNLLYQVGVYLKNWQKVAALQVS